MHTQNRMAYRIQSGGWFWGPSSAKIPTFGTEQQLDRGAKLHIHILVQVWLPSDKNTIVHLKITHIKHWISYGQLTISPLSGDKCSLVYEGCGVQTDVISTTYLEKGVKRMFIRSIDFTLHGQCKVWLEAIARSDIFQTVEDFRSVGTGFLL